MEMEYRRLGRTGLKVSVLSFGSWVTFGPQLAGNLAEDCLGAAYDAGVNFFDNAEAYAGRRVGADHGRGHPGPRAGPATATSSPPSSSGDSTPTSTCATPSTAST